MGYNDSLPAHEGQNYPDEPQQRRGKFKVLPLIIFAVIGVFYYFSHQEVVPITGRKQMVALSPNDETALGLQSTSLELRSAVPSARRGDGPEWHCAHTVLTIAASARSRANVVGVGAPGRACAPCGTKWIGAPAACARPPRWQLSQLMPTVTC